MLSALSPALTVGRRDPRVQTVPNSKGIQIKASHQAVPDRVVVLTMKERVALGEQLPPGGAAAAGPREGWFRE